MLPQKMDTVSENLWLLAQEGDPKAQREYGLACLEGKGINSDGPEEGLSFLTKAAEAGDIPAKYFLGEIYRTGQFGGLSCCNCKAEHNYKRAFQLLSQAAQSGHPDAKYSLNLLLLLGGESLQHLP
jgi:TPR repeat protein